MQQLQLGETTCLVQCLVSSHCFWFRIKEKNLCRHMQVWDCFESFKIVDSVIKTLLSPSLEAAIHRKFQIELKNENLIWFNYELQKRMICFCIRNTHKHYEHFIFCKRTTRVRKVSSFFLNDVPKFETNKKSFWEKSFLKSFSILKNPLKIFFNCICGDFDSLCLIYF